LNIIFPLILLLALMSSCDKGYEVRFTNYYIEPMDSVVIGSAKVVFRDIKFGVTTDFSEISYGNYSVMFVSRSKKRFYSRIDIPKSGTGKRTIQIDGITQIAVLEE